MTDTTRNSEYFSTRAKSIIHEKKINLPDDVQPILMKYSFQDICQSEVVFLYLVDRTNHQEVSAKNLSSFLRSSRQKSHQTFSITSRNRLDQNECLKSYLYHLKFSFTMANFFSFLLEGG